MEIAADVDSRNLTVGAGSNLEGQIAYHHEDDFLLSDYRARGGDAVTSCGLQHLPIARTSDVGSVRPVAGGRTATPPTRVNQRRRHTRNGLYRARQSGRAPGYSHRGRQPEYLDL